MTNSPRTAWIDESVRIAGAEPPISLLGGPLVPSERSDEARSTLRALNRGRKKLHCREMDRRSRTRAVEATRELPVRSVVVRTPVDPRRQERARALCLERLCWTLERAHAVPMAVLEARPASLMRRDIDLVNAFRSRSVVSPRLRVRHLQPLDEPLLWLADIIVGAVGDAHVGRPEWLAAFGDSVEIVQADS